MMRMIGKACIIHPRHTGIFRQPLGHRQSVVAMPLHAKPQRFHARQKQKGVERRNGWPQIAQAQNPCRNGQCHRPESLVQLDAIIRRIGFGKQRIGTTGRPIEIASVNQRATHRIAMPANEFGERMHHHIGPVFERLHQIGCGQRVIHNQRHARLFRHRRNRLNIRDAPTRIGDGFDEDCLGARRQSLLKTRRIFGIRPHNMPAEAFEGMGELVDRAAI